MTNFHHIFIDSDELYWVHEMRLEFNAPPNIRNEYGQSIKSSKLDAKGVYIDVLFDTGFHREQLLSLLSGMVCCVEFFLCPMNFLVLCFFFCSQFGITPVIVKRSTSVSSDMELDSDIEFIEELEFDDEEPPPDDETRMEIDLPFEPLLAVDQSTPIRSAPIKMDRVATPKTEPSSPAAAKRTAKDPREIFVKPKSPPAAAPDQIDLSNESTDKQSSEIPSRSFYGKKKAIAEHSKKVPSKPLTPPPTPPKRARRTSAKTALSNIRKTMEQSQYDFDENENGEVELKRKRTKTATAADATAQPKKAKRPKKKMEPPKWPVLDIKVNHGNKGPRKLYTVKLDMSDDKTAPKTPKVVKRAPSRRSTSELTSTSYCGSAYGDPEKQQNRFFENVMKINERAHRKQQTDNLNASYSYRRAMYKIKDKEPSKVIYTQADSTSPNAVSNFIILMLMTD